MLTECRSFKSIDATPCHNSAHPLQVDSTVAFSIRDTASETPSTVSVSEVTTRHLRRLKQSATDYLGKEVNAAVVTVPTDFNDAQREVLTTAAKAAGLEVLQLLHEPVAAALAYDARPEATVTDKLIVVADLGGTRSDAAVIACRGGMYTILATAHDYELGGSSLDKIVIDHFAKEFIKKHKSDPRENARGLAKLKLEGEATRKALSLGTNATLSIESLADGIDYGSTINRTRYELLSSKVFAQFTRLIEQVIKKAKLDVLDIDEVCDAFPYLRVCLMLFDRLSSPVVFLTRPRLPSWPATSSPKRPRFWPHPQRLPPLTHPSSLLGVPLSRLL
jgi:molecular chaperone DnaK (HSP70)